MNGHILRRVVIGVLVGALLLTLNMAALTFGWGHPEVFIPAIFADLGGLALTFWLAWRREIIHQGVTERV